MVSQLDKCKLIELPRIPDSRGCLTFIEGGQHIPFDIRRVYYLYDLNSGSSRGAHGHRCLEQLIVALSGSFEITIDDGFNKKAFHLKHAYEGLYVPPMVWRDLTDFSSSAVCMVLASEKYDEKDYYRDYDSFLADARGSN